MQRLAGPGTFPEQIAVPIAVGPEIPREGIEPLRAAIDELLPGTVVAPMYLRGRAIGVLMAIGATDDALRDLAAEGAAAIALADDLHRPHRRRPPAQAHEPRRRDPATPAPTPHPAHRRRADRRQRAARL